MRTPGPARPPVALTIAGSDSGGGAGIQADLKTMEAHGAFGTSVITAVTAQNTQGVEGSYVLPAAEIEAQYRAVVDDFDVRAVKTGMLATSEVIELVADLLETYDGPVVVDPVMVAASGDRLLAPEAEAAYERLVARSTVVTPNTDEAEVLTGVAPTDAESAREAGAALVEMGADAALVKGGHMAGDVVTDTLVTADGATIVEHPRVDSPATHGSGCTLSSAIAARLADDGSLASAVEGAVAFMERAVRYPLDVGRGPGAVHHQVALRERADRAAVMDAVETLVESFVAWDVRRLVPEVGMGVVGASPYAERRTELAAVEGRISRTVSGVAPTRGVRQGASTHLADALLAAREVRPDLRFAVNVRLDDEVERTLESLGETAVVRVVDGSGDDPATRVGAAVEPATETPVAVVDPGAVGREAGVTLLAAAAAPLQSRVRTLLDAVERD
jgi:hydroxymethylpyrimidine/phosphomethylpyrimidine kinase